jgi:hypothetical protein
VQPPVLGRQARRTRKYGTFQTNNRHQLLSLRAPPGFPGTWLKVVEEPSTG